MPQVPKKLSTLGGARPGAGRKPKATSKRLRARQIFDQFFTEARMRELLELAWRVAKGDKLKDATGKESDFGGDKAILKSLLDKVYGPAERTAEPLPTTPYEEAFGKALELMEALRQGPLQVSREQALGPGAVEDAETSLRG